MSGAFRLPLIPIFIVFATGIYFGHFDFLFFSQTWILLLILIGFWIFFLATKKARIGSWTTFSIFFLLGMISIQGYLFPRHSSSHLSHFTGPEEISLEGVIDSPPEHSRERTRLLIRSDKIVRSGGPIPVNGLLLVFLKEEDPSLRAGDRLRLRCRLYTPRGFQNPGGFSYERNLALDQIYTIGFLPQGRGWVKLGEGFKNPATLQVERWRDHIRDFLNREAPSPSVGIFKALALGEQGDLPEEIKEHFILTGTAHLLAISGDQFGIVALLSFSLLIWAFTRSEFLLLSISVRKWAAALTIPCIVLYAFIAGGGISVIRAAIMVVTFLFSILLNRERNLLHTLALAAFLILAFSPPSLFDVSFQLSFVAVLSILYLVPRILQAFKPDGLSLLLKTSWKKNIWRYLRLSLLVTGVAIVGTAPWVAFHFNRFSPIGFVTNLFVIPWVGFLIVPLTLTASIVSFLFLPLATFLIHLNGLITLILLRVLALMASLPFASFYVSTPTVLEIVLFYSLLYLLVHFQKDKKLRYLFVGLCMFFACDLAYWNWKDSFQKDLKLTFIDVGHGDSVLVEFPKGKMMLIDGGGLSDDRFDTGKNVIAPFLWKKKIRRIDTLVLTHPDPDHLKGLNFIASQFSIGQFWESGLETQSEPYLRLREILRRKNIRARSLNQETAPQMMNGVEVSILNPPAPKATQRSVQNPSNLNNSSLVLKLQFKNVSVLLAGDIEKEAEESMLRKEYPLQTDILKVPHHGSSSSSSPLFLEKVRPVYAILSVGERNIARLPHPDVLKRYERLGTKIFRTDRHGAITVVTDGKDIKIRPFLTPNE